MDIVIESVKKLETLLGHSGCCDSGVLLDVDPEVVSCRYEKGACMTATFGGKRGVFTTFDPIRACTRSLSCSVPRSIHFRSGAACAIINVAAGFFCMARTLQPCDESRHNACRAELLSHLAGKRVYIHGADQTFGSFSELNRTDDPSCADILLIGSEGCVDPGTGDLIGQYAEVKRIILIGPSTAGIARMNELEHWCPFGKT